MSKEKSSFKKILVRNTEHTIPKTVVLTENKNAYNKEKELKSLTNKPVKNVDKEAFELPELYSTLKLSKKLDNIVKPRKTKSALTMAESKKDKLAVDEKVTRLVNFPYDQPIYKELIQLTSASSQSQSTIHKRLPQGQKDREPSLSDFVTEYVVPECYYRTDVTVINRSIPSANNNLRLYNILQIHNE